MILTLLVVFILAGLVGIAMSYTQQQGRLTKRAELSNLAMEVGDGCLEVLFTHWRDIYRSTGALILPTNYFYTSTYAPGARPASNPPPLIPEPTKAMFPDVPQNFTISNFRVQAVTPMLNVKKDFPKYYINPVDPEQSTVRDTDTAPPLSGKTTFYKDEEPRCFPGAFGTGALQYSFYYLASVDVTYPALGGKTVTSKVRRVFEKKFNTPWTWGLFYNGDLELNPNGNLTINGKIHTNSNLYTGSNKLTLTEKTTFNGAWTTGYSPHDTMHTATPTAPNYPSNLPPGQDSSYLPFGWDAQKMFNLGDNNPNNEGYREIIERPVTAGGFTDPVAPQRYYNQADIKILVDANNNLEIRNSANQVITPTSSNTNDKNIAQAVRSATNQNETFTDNREGGVVRVFTVDISKLTQAINSNLISDPNGYGIVIYMSDTSSSPGNRRGVRIKNGSAIPANGLTIVSDSPLYLRGDFNTGTNPPSNTTDITRPTASGYTRSPSAIIADSITLQSNNWNDSTSSSALASRVASNTTVNAALVAGNVPSANGNYSGGAENFVRFMEDWSNKRFTYYGSMAQIFPSQNAIGLWGKDNVYTPPTQVWYYDSNFEQKSPPGNLVFASYLQQQRWYLVY